MKKPFIIAFFLCFIAATVLSAQPENASDPFSPSETVIRKHIRVPEGSTCQIVAKQKLHEGNYKIYYIKSFPDGRTEVESILLQHVENDNWIVNETRVLPAT